MSFGQDVAEDLVSVGASRTSGTKRGCQRDWMAVRMPSAQVYRIHQVEKEKKKRRKKDVFKLVKTHYPR